MASASKTSVATGTAAAIPTTPRLEGDASLTNVLQGCLSRERQRSAILREFVTLRTKCVCALTFMQVSTVMCAAQMQRCWTGIRAYLLSASTRTSLAIVASVADTENASGTTFRHILTTLFTCANVTLGIQISLLITA